jgi:predicted TIM-barrel fold metal-dependent hydrolase
MNHAVLILPVLLLGCARIPDAQSKADPALLREISGIRAIDVHSHSLPAGEGVEDAGSLEPYLSSLASSDPAMIRVVANHHDYVLAWRALYGYSYDDMHRDHVLETLERKKRLIREKGNSYPAWVLDQAGIETQFVFPLTKLGDGQTSPRFLWVPLATPLVYPFAGDQRELKDLLVHAGAPRLPPTLVEYTKTVVRPTLERWKRDGAVGLKFGIAYRRPLSFADAPEGETASIYQKYARAGEPPPPTQYKAVQDYLFRFVAREAGRVGLVFFTHTGVGHDDYFNISGANPALLESIFNDSTMRGTQFVIVHGGWPYDKEAGVMLQKPNVYADFSVQPLLRSTRALSITLRAWLEWAPEKVLFGTDAYSEPGTPLANWEEKTWVASRMAREAIAIALTEMIDDGQVTREQALLLARMVLRDNAIRLFGLKSGVNGS